MATEEVRVLRREAIVPSSDRGRLAAIVATCSLAGLAGGMALSMLAETHRAAREMRGGTRYHHRAALGPTTWLGVDVVTADKDRCSGARVKEVAPNGPADRVGFHAGDLIVSYGGDPICGNDHLIDVVRASTIGATPEIEVRRGARELTLQPTLAAMPPGIRAAIPPDDLR